VLLLAAHRAVHHVYISIASVPFERTHEGLPMGLQHTRSQSTHRTDARGATHTYLGVDAAAADLLADTPHDVLETMLHFHSPLKSGSPLSHVLAQLPEQAHLPALRAYCSSPHRTQTAPRVCELHLGCLAGCQRAAELLSSVPQATHVKIHVPLRMSTQRAASGVAALAASLAGAAPQIAGLQVRAGVACNVTRIVAGAVAIDAEHSQHVMQHLWPLLPLMRELTRLDLSHCALNDAAVEHLARWAAAARPPLRSLDVSWNQFTATGFAPLAAALAALPDLHRLIARTTGLATMVSRPADWSRRSKR
jgi:Leucine Rich repeat